MPDTVPPRMDKGVNHAYQYIGPGQHQKQGIRSRRQQNGETAGVKQDRGFVEIGEMARQFSRLFRLWLPLINPEKIRISIASLYRIETRSKQAQQNRKG